ncbi:hypothetical protein CVT25_002477 [Psilocybe cyanescens]|uniref:Uncharacterized protein n=1 Tax=Psilocybe cyanescens TaxID=93625 RepID=A0A409XK65_PSICY|nr:hypothetical protein CVT25_002477 [Psilocybe cyanescens]
MFKFKPRAIFIALMLLWESLKGLVAVSLAENVISEIPGNHGDELEGGIDEADGKGQYYMGSINNGQGLDTSHISQLDAFEGGDDFELEVQFTDEEYVDAEVIDEW